MFKNRGFFIVVDVCIELCQGYYVKDGSIDDRSLPEFLVFTLALILFNVFSVDANPSSSALHNFFSQVRT